MSMNNVQLQGRVCFTKYMQGEGEKKSFISFAISYNTGRKENPEDQYNKENLFRCKAFGATADFIAKNFPDKSQILIDGTLDIGNDFTNKDNELVKGGVEINVARVHFCGFKETGSTDNSNSIQSPKAAPAPAPKPVVAPKPAVSPKPAVAPRPIVPRR